MKRKDTKRNESKEANHEKEWIKIKGKLERKGNPREGRSTEKKIAKKL